MSDLIRRQDAFRAILGVTTYDTVDDVEIHCDASVADSEGWLGGVRDALRAIEYVPSAEPERKWIPVTEALPEEDDDVLLLMTEGEMVVGQRRGVNYWDGYRRRAVIVAWMPLPEPMKEGE